VVKLASKEIRDLWREQAPMALRTRTENPHRIVEILEPVEFLLQSPPAIDRMIPPKPRPV
jgi:hypothetical protein